MLSATDIIDTNSYYLFTLNIQKPLNKQCRAVQVCCTLSEKPKNRGLRHEVARLSRKPQFFVGLSERFRLANLGLLGFP